MGSDWCCRCRGGGGGSCGCMCETIHNGAWTAPPEKVYLEMSGIEGTEECGECSQLNTEGAPFVLPFHR